MSKAIQQTLLSETLGQNGNVTLWRKNPNLPYRVIFRYQGKQINRSTGATSYAEAKLSGARIYAEVVRGPEEAVSMAAIKGQISDLKELVLKLSLGMGSGSKNPHVKFEVKTLGFAVEAFKTAKIKEGLAEETVPRLIRRLEEFKNFIGEGTCMPEISSESIERWLDSKPDNSGRTRWNDLVAVAQFLRWAGKAPRLWCNPDICGDVAKPKKGGSMIGILTIEQGEKLMEFIEENHPQYVLFYAIALLAGVRANKKNEAGDTKSGEIVRLLDFVKKHGWTPEIWNGLVLHIPSGKIGGRPRQVHTPQNLKAWLRAYPGSLEVPHRAWHTRHVAKPFGLPKNGLRHTAASAYISSVGDFARAAILFGTSEGVLKARYVLLMTKEMAERFWKIFPKRVCSAVNPTNAAA
jgi:hypothetical protein